MNEELTPEIIKQFVERPFAFIQRMGLNAVSLEHGHVKLRAPLAGNENHIGTMYAGALFTLAEVPGGALYLTTFDVKNYYPIVKEMSIKFLKPARTDISVELNMDPGRVEAIQHQAEINKKAEFVLKGELKDEKGMVVAESSGVYQLRAMDI